MSSTTTDAGAEPRLRTAAGDILPLHVGSWSAPADPVELRQLEDVRGPVLDLGCGPGRLVVALAERGIPALGIDASPAAVSLAVERRASALVRSIFDPLPGTGRWATALLFDGNIGIGGDPVRLLSRVRELVCVDGRAVVEVGGPGTATETFPVRVERGTECSDWFGWGHVGLDGIEAIAEQAELHVDAAHEDDHRWFVHLTPGSP